MHLTELKILASQQLRENTKKSRKEMLALLHADLLHTVIENLVNSPSELNEVASRSYCHKNGFLKLLLIDQRPYYSIRLHLWPKIQLQDGDIHNHPWDMSGLVLTGAYTSYNYTIGEKSQKKSYLSLYECRYLKDYSGHSFINKGNIQSVETSQQDFRSGDFFQLPATNYHIIRKNNSTSADSIVITGNSDALTANVISSREIICNKPIYNESMNSIHLKKKLLSFIERCCF